MEHYWSIDYSNNWKMEITSYKNQLTPQGAEELAKELDGLLKDVQIYRQNVRKLHWNNKLRPFFNLHESLGKLDQVVFAGEEILAQQILMLGYSPTTLPNTQLSNARLTPFEQTENFDEAIGILIHNSKELLTIVKEVFDKAVELNAEHTVKLMSQVAKQIGLNIWYYTNMRMAQFN